MKILILDIAASTSGALSILNDLIKNLGETNSNFEILVSTNKVISIENTSLVIKSWPKKSWLHRLIFDYIYLPLYVKRKKFDKVFSLQNVIVPFCKIEQLLYVHQSLPFTDIKYSFTQDKKIWIYQNIISKIIIHSIRKASYVFVQTEWMKEKICLYKSSKDILVVKPYVEKYRYLHFNNPKEINFFYPAMPFDYKNHIVIFKAISLLKKNRKNFKVFLTTSGNENKYIRSIKKKYSYLTDNIEWMGNISREQVFDLYASTVLLFPSKIESFGMPLLEARNSNSVILAADRPFSQEILFGYNNAYFFEMNDFNELAKLMNKCINSQIISTDTKAISFENNGWMDVLKIIES